MRPLLVGFGLLMLFGHAFADDTPSDPKLVQLQKQSAELKAQADVIAQQNAVIAARFGAAATTPTGTITNPDKFSAMGQWTLGQSVTDAADEVVTWATTGTPPILPATCGREDGPILITSTQDRRAAVMIADLIDRRLADFTVLLAAPPSSVSGAPAGARNMALTGGVAAISGLVGSLDTLVGLFRSDFSFSDIQVTADDLTLRLALATAFKKHQASVLVDGIAGPTDRKYQLLTDYVAFDTARQNAARAYVEATAHLDDKKKATLDDRKALLDAAAAFDTALTTAANGAIPLLSAALAKEYSGEKQCVVYLKFAGYSSSIVTRKHLLSRNDEVTAIAGGTVEAVAFNTKGDLLGIKLVRIDERLAGHLTSIVKSARKLEDLQR